MNLKFQIMQKLMKLNKPKNLSTREFEQFNRGFEEKKNHKHSVQLFWVKIKVSAREYNTHYSQHPNYTFLSKDKDGIIVGYAVGREIPPRAEEANFQDIEKIYQHRKMTGLRPIPKIGQQKAQLINKEAVDVLAEQSDDYLSKVAKEGEIPF